MNPIMNETNLEYLSNKFNTFIIELEGVIWDNGTEINNSIQAIKYLITQKKKIILISNLSIYSRKTISNMLHKISLDLPISNIYTSGYITAIYIKREYPDIQKVYCIAREGMVEELAELGINYIGMEHDKMSIKENNLKDLEVDKDIGCVIVGFDNYFNFYKLSYAANIIVQNSAHFLAVNNQNLVMINGLNIPGGGSLASAVEVPCEKAPLVVGCPEIYIMKVIEEEHIFQGGRDEVILIGSGIDTVIQMGIRMELHTCYVPFDASLLGNIPLGEEPEYFIHSLGTLTKL